MQTTNGKPSAKPAVSASIHFMTANPLYEIEKPYAFRYPVGGAVAQTNMAMQRIDGIPIEDIRGREDAFTFERDGFAIMHLKEPRFAYATYFDPDEVQAYLRALERVLQKALGAEEVKVFRHGLRKRDPDFPRSTGEAYDYDQPTSVAHVGIWGPFSIVRFEDVWLMGGSLMREDTTPQEARNEIRRQYGRDAEKYLRRRHQWVNVWKPLRGPLNDWPLTFCTASTVAPGDLEAADLLYPDLATENYQVYHKDGYRWYYLSDHADDELIAFKQSDSEPGACLGVPHCSFFNPLASKEELPRESIEARALVFYD